VVLQLGGWAWGLQLTVKNKLVRKTFTKPRKRAHVNAVMNHKMPGSSRVAAPLVDSQEGLSSRSE
jgi:hypothetical protein